MQTAVEWLIEQIKNDQNQKALSAKEWIDIFEETKSKEKQEKIKLILMWDIHTTLKEEDKGCMSEIEKFVAETYGSKGSDEIKKAEEMGLYDKIELANPNDSIFTSSQTDMKDNKIMLLEEDLWCVHKYLDDLNIERNDGDGKQYSIVGRIKLLENKFLYQMSELETNLSNSQTEISDEEILIGLKNSWADYEYDNGNLYSTTYRDGWVNACKWYREQLKKKQ